MGSGRRPVGGRGAWWARCVATLLVWCAAFSAPQLWAQQPSDVSTREVEPTFKIQVERNLVQVRVIVRDAKGQVVQNLRKEDFQVFDRGKVQTILHFSLEVPGAPAAAPSAPKPPEEQEGDNESAPKPASANGPSRFLALYLDDVHTSFEDLGRARDAALRYLASAVQPGDRVGVFTTSGQKQRDFTGDMSQVHQALLDLRPRPMVPKTKTCVDIPPYEAYLIFEQHDSQALEVAADEAFNNCYASMATNAQTAAQARAEAQQDAQAEASQVCMLAEQESRAVLRGIEELIRHLALLPGQRSMIIISDGFLTETLHFELSQLIDRALRVRVTLNALDARGLYTDPGIPDATQRGPDTTNVALVGRKSSLLSTSAVLESSGMRSLATETGGVFFGNSNDLEEGFRRAAALPDAYYVLAFSPQNLKLDGSFHPLKVKLVSASGLSVQARRGYYAPRKVEDPAEREKEEIQEALFSQDELRELPVEVRTQYFMKCTSEAQLAVLARLDLHPVHFRKEADRSADNLTFVTGLFDRDGHLVTAQEKIVQLRLRDASLAALLQSGVTLRTHFDVKPGTYLVRAVVRDSEGGQIAGLNRTVEIPYQ